MKYFRGAILTFLIMLSLPTLSYALYGGETISYNFPNCNILTANITNATLREWNLTPNCNEDSAGNFTCSCTDNYNLNLAPKTNSIGTFKILITDYYSISSTTTSTSTNSYVSTSCKNENYVCTQFQKCCSGLICENNICIPTSTSMIIIPTLNPSTSTSSTETTSTSPTQSNNLLLPMTIIIIMGIVGFTVWRLKKPKKVQIDE